MLISGAELFLPEEKRLVLTLVQIGKSAVVV